MRKITLILLGVLYIGSLHASSGPVDSLAIKYGNSIESTDLSKHLHILASDSFLGRETGQLGQKMAAEYISNQFASFNIKPLKNSNVKEGYYQRFPLELQHPQGASMNSAGVKYEFINDFYYFPGFEDLNISTKELLFLGYGIEDKAYNDYGSLDVEGKILVVFAGEPMDKKGRSLITGGNNASQWTTNWRLKEKIAKEKKAAALIIISEDYQTNVDNWRHFIEKPSLKLILEEDTVKSIKLPTFYISPNLATKLFESLGKKGSMDKIQKKIGRKKNPVSHTLDVAFKISMNREVENLSSENVLGFIEGTDKKDEILIITAHYDHLGVKDEVVFNGADDDGSGTVAVIEMAEAFALAKKNGHGPRRSVLFMPVAGEEKGLLGSEYYVKNPIFPLENTIANLNIDMIGRVDTQHTGDPNYVYLIGADKLSSELHEISSKTNENYTNLKLDYTYNDPNDPNRFYYRSDHYNFASNNIPVIFYFTGIHEDYHKATDTVDKIDFEKMEKITKLVFFTAWNLANREDRIVVDKIEE
ncbi:MAG: M28 family peptidase [Flavobacteriales bacterium]|nr:M28 family peptidase [Flavobacteriales bacterium]